ncbi:MAG: 3-deoxy-D-manno-octulosonic acid transferase [Rhodospirillaceae bacterium]|nr:3-deoxy-D-manno-octulosonic acid transferase [Rhodospirillaceae bacterium]|tara:strand:+ start:3955 stop:5253 length:1299 start_codon:yes stop_codon:yes gene_type:complete
MILSAYRGLSYAAAPILRGFIDRRRLRGKEDSARINERFGQPSEQRPSGSVVWFHAASVGESISILSLVNRLKEDYPALSILVTTGTVTSAKIMADRLPKPVIHQFIPIDQPVWIQKFLDHWKPNLVLWIESEFWPNLLTAIKARNIPLILVNARVSPSSFRGWKRLPRTISRLLHCFSLCLAQSEQDAEKLRILGAEQIRIPGNIKYAADPLPVDDAALSSLWNEIGARPIWVAASTHEGEEIKVADVHAAVAQNYPDILTIIIPRHPARGAEIASTLAMRGLSVAQRSEVQTITSESEIYVADTVGELGLFYRLAPIAFIGGTLVPHGGQNILEAAKLECAIIHGPSTTNFTEITIEIADVGGSISITNEIELADAVGGLLADKERRAAQISAASTIAKSKSDILDHVMRELAPFLASLTPQTATQDARA